MPDLAFIDPSVIFSLQIRAHASVSHTVLKKRWNRSWVMTDMRA